MATVSSSSSTGAGCERVKSTTPNSTKPITHTAPTAGQTAAGPADDEDLARSVHHDCRRLVIEVGAEPPAPGEAAVGSILVDEGIEVQLPDHEDAA